MPCDATHHQTVPPSPSPAQFRAQLAQSLSDPFLRPFIFRARLTQRKSMTKDSEVPGVCVEGVPVLSPPPKKKGRGEPSPHWEGGEAPDTGDSVPQSCGDFTICTWVLGHCRSGGSRGAGTSSAMQKTEGRRWGQDEKTGES